MATQRVTRGRTALLKPMARPVMIVGAVPVSLERAMCRMGGPLVKYSLSSPMSTPATMPASTAQKGPTLSSSRVVMK